MPHTAAGDTPVSMIERVTLILEAFRTPGEFLALGAVARRTGLPYSSTHRILEQLIRLEWVALTPAGYGLGRRGMRFRGEATGHGRLREAAGPHLHALHLRTGLAVYLTVLDAYDELVLDRIGACRGGRESHRVGARRSLPRTVGGRAILAALEPEKVDAVVGMHPAMEARAGRPVSVGGTLAMLHADLDRIRRSGGLAVARAGAGPGRRPAPRGVAVGTVLGLAVHVAVPGGTTAAACLYPQGSRPVRDWSVPLVVQTARRIGAELGVAVEPVSG